MMCQVRQAKNVSPSSYDFNLKHGVEKSSSWFVCRFNKTTRYIKQKIVDILFKYKLGHAHLSAHLATVQK